MHQARLVSCCFALFFPSLNNTHFIKCFLRFPFFETARQSESLRKLTNELLLKTLQIKKISLPGNTQEGTQMGSTPFANGCGSKQFFYTTSTTLNSELNAEQEASRGSDSLYTFVLRLHYDLCTASRDIAELHCSTSSAIERVNTACCSRWLWEELSSPTRR